MKTENLLHTLNRMDLILNLKNLVKREKELTIEILDYLQVISSRKIFLEMGYPSLYAFLTGELGYCSGTAYLRTQTMKAIAIPENRDRVLNDEVSLSTLAKTQCFINNENKSLSKQFAPLLTEGEEKELFNAVEGVAAHKAEEVLIEKKHEMEAKKSKEQGLPLPVKKILKKIHFEADQELMGMIEEIKCLLSHVCPGGDLTDVLKKALPLAIQEVKVKKGLIKRSDVKLQDIKKTDIGACHQGEKGVKTKISQNSLKHQNATSQKSHKIDSINDINISSMKSRSITRSIPTEIKRKVWKRDKGCCQYQDSVTGKRCYSKYKLEFDHIRGWGQGGSHSLENLWLLCREHNRFRYKEQSLGV